MPPRLFRPQGSRPAADRSHCLCPAGERLYRTGHHRNLRGFETLKFTGRKTACGRWTMRARCLRSPEKTPVRQVAISLGPTASKPETYTARMRRKIDSPLGRALITRRFAPVEPVFGNLRHNTRLHRFTLRGGAKVDGQWELYCLVPNIGKVAHLGYAR
jgi:hypothetical protein